MDDYSVPVLVDAKTEYTKQLINILKPDRIFLVLIIMEEMSLVE